MKHHFFSLAGALLLSAFTGAASAAVLPECDSSSILSRVDSKLAIAESNVIQSGDPIITLDHVRHAKTQDLSEPYFPRRFCQATGYTQQGNKKTIYYLIEAKAGFAGYSYNVEACILGRDPWRVYGAYCRSLR
ncbi:hypothetical protein SAMN04488056_106188 [Cohaesibacter marisflavi]|uniref:Uncharacterized protein n=1 Tax=Cohaesibacter marisflavi TaxID=655353 RepID=A0A1I5HEC4_9HYPH|nr:hypothetical protein [Cohaesibacter marisflavi]SFO46529.1 hypothetical protein SAMN04488056_106188 [Cohaesibacter marisflavi]